MSNSACAPAVALLIDDDPDCLRMLTLLLQRMWPEMFVLGAGTMAEGLRHLAQVTPDFVVSDLALPDSTPDNTLDTLLVSLPQDVPLVVISGYVTPLEGQEMLVRGADAFVPKGMPPGDVQRIILHTWFRAHGRIARQNLSQGMAQDAPYDS